MKLLLILDAFDMQSLPKLKGILQGHTVSIISKPVDTLAQLAPIIKKQRFQGVLCCSVPLLKRLVTSQQGGDAKKDPNIMDYRGSMFQLHGLPCLILPSPKVLYTVPTAPYLFRRWIRKITLPNFPSFPKLDWELLTAANAPAMLELFKTAVCIAVDIETTRQTIADDVHETNPPELKGLWVRGKVSATSKKMHNFIPTISECGYCGLFKKPDGTYYSLSIVLPIESMYDVELMRKFNDLAPPKIMQNGGYDSTYFIRFASPLRNYLYDTYHFMHSWYAELPRTLNFIVGLFDRDYMYWKDEHTGGNYEYNAKDTHNTLWSWVFMLQESPQWAKDNFAENFRMVFPCITCGLEGFKADPLEHLRLRDERVLAVDKAQSRLDNVIQKGFNPNSPKQVLQLMHGVGYKKATKTGKVEMTKFKEAHPLHEFLGNMIGTIREDRKAISTYFDLQLFNGRLLFELNPSGTDTGRLASKASNLWCGTQVQNIPLYARGMYVPDEGYELTAIDNGQSESRCTAYISEDSNLMQTVEHSPDFHCTNASLFFGIPEDEMMHLLRDTETGEVIEVKVLRKDIRKVGKKVNHGANYNMGWKVLWESMGTKAVLNAKKLLKLPIKLSIRQVCEYLLNCFDVAYPDVRGKYYNEVIEEIQRTSKLVGATGWTRYCFGDPTASKPQLNSYVAHPPQSLSVKIINAAFFDCWLELQMKQDIVRMKAQVHDEIIFQTKPEHTKAAVDFVSKRMEEPTLIRGRTMIIPNDPAVGVQRWSDLKD